MRLAIQQHANALRLGMTVLAFVSLLLCGGMMALCVRSYWRCDTYEAIRPIDVKWLRLARGEISYVFLDGTSAGKRYVGPPATAVRSERVEDVKMWQQTQSKLQLNENSFIGFCYVRAPDFALVAEVPMWALVTASALLPLWWLPNPLRRRCAAAGCCPDCGYDLRASREHCPECGRALPRPLAPAIRSHRPSRLQA